MSKFLFRYISLPKEPICGCFAVGTAIFFLPAIFGYFGFGKGLFNGGNAEMKNESFVAAWLHIFPTNIRTALSCYSGALTFGITALFFGLLMGMYFGISVSLAHSVFGVMPVLLKTILYTPFELTGFIAAIAAGLIPAAYVLSRASNRDIKKGKLNKQDEKQSMEITFATAVKDSLVVFLFAAVMLLLSSVLEACVVAYF